MLSSSGRNRPRCRPAPRRSLAIKPIFSLRLVVCEIQQRRTPITQTRSGPDTEQYLTSQRLRKLLLMFSATESRIVQIVRVHRDVNVLENRRNPFVATLQAACLSITGQQSAAHSKPARSFLPPRRENVVGGQRPPDP